MAKVGAAISIRFEDESLAVLSKPAGLTVHPGDGVREHTLVDELALLWPANKEFDAERYGLVHRLDKDTSGLLLVAKTAHALSNIRALFVTRTVTKRYRAVVEGTPKQPEGVIDAPISRHVHERHKMAVLPGGKSARTTYSVVAGNGRFSLLDVWIESGRTHQIRVHLSALGNPVVGDVTYGARDSASRQLLHAVGLTLPHPVTAQVLKVTDELPSDMRDFLKSEGLA